MNERGVFVLEIAGRPIGGLCSRMLQFASGHELEEVILRHAAGDDDGSAERLREGGSGVMMIPIPMRKPGVYRGVTGVEDALAVPGIEGLEITAKEGHELVPLPEGASYLGFLFARGAAAEAALRSAHGKLRFGFTESLPVL